MDYTKHIENLNEPLPDYVKLGFIAAYVKTQRGLDTVERISTWPHWSALFTLGLILTLLTMIGGLVLVGSEAVEMMLTLLGLDTGPRPEPTAINNPKNMVVVPGVNEFLPAKEATLIIGSIIAALVIHEFAHAVAARTYGVSIKESGVILLFYFFPAGAYVLPGDDFDDANTIDATRILSAGILANLVLVAGSILYFSFGDTSIATAYMYYFGILPNVPMTAVELSWLDKVVWWTLFMNVNLALTNALPIYGLDGGQILYRVFGTRMSNQKAFHSTILVTVVVLVVLFVFLFGPYVTVYNLL
jgi:Zn-dependent protease